MIMSEACQSSGKEKGPLNLNSVAAAVEDLLYQADVPKEEFSSFLKRAIAEKKKKKRGGALKDPDGGCQNAFEKFNCSFEDLFGSDIGAFQDSIHFFEPPKSKKTLDLISLKQGPHVTEGEDNESVSSSSSGILPPKRDTASGASSRAKELARKREKPAEAKQIGQEIPIFSPIKVRQRVSVKSLGRLNSPRRRTRVIRSDASSARGMPDLSSLRGLSEKSPGRSVSPRHTRRDFAESPRRSSREGNESPRRRSSRDGTDFPGKQIFRNSTDSPRRRSRKIHEDDDARTVLSNFTAKDASSIDSADVTARKRSKSVPKVPLLDDRSLSPRRRSTRDGSHSPRRRPRSLSGDDTMSLRSKVPSSKPSSNKAHEAASLSPRRKIGSSKHRKDASDSSEKYCDDFSVVSKKFTAVQKWQDRPSKSADVPKGSDPIPCALVRKVSVWKQSTAICSPGSPDPRLPRKEERLSSSDHASPASTRYGVKKMDPLSQSEHITRKGVGKVIMERPN